MYEENEERQGNIKKIPYVISKAKFSRSASPKLKRIDSSFTQCQHRKTKRLKT